MDNRNTRIHIRSGGFSLMEFLVASALGMIVLIAATSGYFDTRALDKAAGERTVAQQDLRRAADMLVRDAHMAGSFGCFDMRGAAGSAVRGDDALDMLQSLQTAGQTSLQAVKASASAAALNTGGFTATSSALVFLYGEPAGMIYQADEEIAAGAPVVYSSCDRIFRPSEHLQTAAEIRAALGIGGNSDGEVSVMRYTPAAYAVGSADGQEGLYRFVLGLDGRWGSPQLLVKNISSWNVSYLYAAECRSDGHAELFEHTHTVRAGETPALIHIRLNGGKVGEADNAVVAPVIEAAVGGGSSCAKQVR
ncbi:PilW family protein [Neisseria animalis]|uniref:Pilus assembly protein PilW n=1 Tax=Neisseria animalis TaxID=492 RepID=A0A5P3MRZ3_NEIAN|nr:hypothetical protein [Neisseria animalis]QEY24354.1 hypothetical protein D0T90_07550 [Neisseria animalis]ROW31737.1 hypothetical protein CGZ60_08735 [Neisseria animalis]VEE06858.1 prepilin-type N-terminal cleavage/methylation domain-containing protein [Neisseria animalis]